MIKGYRNIRIPVAIFLVIFHIMGSLTLVAAQDEHHYILTFSGGTGTFKDPYLLSSVKDLLDFAKAGTIDHQYYQAHYKLTANINLKEDIWYTAGGQRFFFSGVFDGNDKTITLKKIADDSYMGLFGRLGRGGTIKNLTVKADISQSFSLNEDIFFGLIASTSEGNLENCITEGKIDLNISSSNNLSIGGMVGKAMEGSITSVMNKSSLNLKLTGDGDIYIGGVVGELTGKFTAIKDVTNQGEINATYEGVSRVGGVAGLVGFEAMAENLLNQGKVSTKITKAQNRNVLLTGGIVGELREAKLGKALNKGSVFCEHTGELEKGELVVAGIAGKSARAYLQDVGNEGDLEGKGANIQHVVGITKSEGDVTVNNAYVKGNLYAYSPYERSELYVMGLGEDISTNNFYVSGKVALKAGKFNEILSDAIANIRPGDATGIYNYCYWNSKMAPFPGYPGLCKPTATCKAVNVDTGRLDNPVHIEGKSYSNISDALNAWLVNRSGGYLQWTKDTVPIFDWTFGYDPPDYKLYKNSREGRWLNTSDWAYEWMDKADKMDIIPEDLINKDMMEKITRKEFAALTVKLYEKMKGSSVNVETDIRNPFIDINDEDVTKAYYLGIIQGVGNERFAPYEDLTREQAATMLTRVYKAVYWEGWTLEKDKEYDKKSLDTAGVPLFNDDAQISDYAKESVYFMVKNGIINGLGNNYFGPIPQAGKDEDYGKATREQAFKISAAMVEAF